MVKRLLPLILIFVATFALLSSYAIYRNGTKYTDEINQAIKLENEDLEAPGVEKDIDKLERSDAKIEIFDKGQFIRITYEIRDNDFITEGYQKLKDGSLKFAGSEHFDNKEADYIENEDIVKE
ncbi:hypothetical protein WKH56_33120 [Priestia sp. SB1]|uniref:hypothetical protein n=1 Tax=Priestia sp. SB1 TaxID=3132359 RepID=UPI00317D02A6